MAKNKVYSFIKKHNSISLSRFINLCLYEPKNGYYQKKKVGEDFLTSPEISQMFGECISVFFAHILKKINTTINFCELGPGNGNLIKDITRSMHKIRKQKINFFFGKNLIYLMKEISRIYNLKQISKNFKNLVLKKNLIFLSAMNFLTLYPSTNLRKKMIVSTRDESNLIQKSWKFLIKK